MDTRDDPSLRPIDDLGPGSALPRPWERVVAIVGAFGSGKTEVTVNLALALAAAGRRVNLVDLDIVNPYFRSREAQRVLEAHGVRVVVPPADQAWADLPIIVPEVLGALVPNANETTLLDVGGDDVGARALGSLRGFLGAASDAKPRCELWQVVNSRRPFTSTVEGCIAMQDALARAARIPVTGIIANSHLCEETDVATVIEGIELAKRVGAARSMPVRFVAARGTFADAAGVSDSGVPVLRLERLMLPPWMRPTSEGAADAAVPLPAARAVPLGRRTRFDANFNPNVN
ncbi:MAG: cobalamin biosynthesis protein CbiA [Planctomycetes bacterium]|nr:cobalamin biosynthesis protein CbiA [Planctomycetota bacterium]